MDYYQVGYREECMLTNNYIDTNSIVTCEIRCQGFNWELEG